MIAPRLPYPPDKGDKLTILNYIKFLSKKHDVTLLTFYKESEKRNIEKVSDYCHQYIPIPHSYFDFFKNCSKTLLGRQSFQQSYYNGNKKMKEAINELINNDPPDIIYCHTLRMAEYVSNIKKIPKILALQISLSLNYRRLKNYTQNYIEKIFYTIEYFLIKKYEYQICSSFEKVLLISKKDLSELEDNAKRKIGNVSFLPHGVDHLYFKSNPKIETKKNTIVMSGNMGYPPNQDAALFFYDTIFPKIKEQVPDAVLYLVGKNPSKAITSLHNGKSVVVTGEVKDIRPYLQMGTIGIVSTRIAAGMQNKLVEAMSMGKAVIATSNANEGIGAVAEQDVIIADDPENFAKYSIELMRKEDKRRRLEKNARVFIEEKFTWEYFLKKLEDIMCRMVERKV